MSSMSDYLESALRGHLFRGAAYTAPGTLYFALFTAAPSDSGGGTEVSGGSYARVGVTPSTANFTAASSTNGITTNANAISFPTATANWGTVTHIGVFDASSGGNLLFWMALTASQAVNSGQQFVIAAGDFSMTFA